MQIEQIIKLIIHEQSNIIGDTLSRQMAESSGVVLYNSANSDDFHLGPVDEKYALEKLITTYAKLFGRASVDVCLNVVGDYPGRQNLIKSLEKTKF